MDLYIAVPLYIVCMVIASGIRGGVRDEMDGIADLFVIVFWPIALGWWAIGLVFKFLYRVGRGFN